MSSTQEASATDLPVKRPREEEQDNGAAMETENGGGDIKEPTCMSSVIPGWFSEMSPMWPGFESLSCFLFLMFGHKAQILLLDL